MVAKQTIAVKIEPEKKEKLQLVASEQGKTISDLLIESLNSAEKMYYLQKKLSESNAQIQELERRHKDLTGKKPNYEKRITVPVTLEEWTRISKEAVDKRTSKGKVIREILTRNTATPALEQ